MLTVEDTANSAAHVLNDLGIDQLHTVVGASMGGMTALAFALEHPARLNVWSRFLPLHGHYHMRSPCAAPA